MGMRNSPDRRAILSSKRVLVAEDEAIVAMLVEDELLEAGAEIVGPAGSVSDALQLIEEAAKDGGLSAAVLEAGAEIVGPAGSVSDALQLIEEAAKDGGLSAAVLDIDLEGEAVKPMADRLAALGVPFLFATGYGMDCDTGGHVAAPVLHKPFDPEELIDIVVALAAK
jgi:CheY-like chemotaxis protein